MPSTFNIKTQQKTEFGDFQTPQPLAEKVVALLRYLGVAPASIIEPTCGRGNLLLAACDEFNEFEAAIGVDISTDYIDECHSHIAHRTYRERVTLQHENFFSADWSTILSKLADPLLFIGNPPWVTNSGVGALGGTNLPEKTNFQRHSGLDALTGKSNFDISEWILIQTLRWLEGREGTLAMLIKTGVARKLLSYAWKNNLSLRYSAMYRINASLHFGASVDACLFICAFSPHTRNHDCIVYKTLEEDATSISKIGWRGGEMVADTDRYDRWKHLRGESPYKWRSGVKHDCSKVMELHRASGGYLNGFGHPVDMEDTYLFPMLKTSEVAKKSHADKRVMLVPQRTVGEDTSLLCDVAPKTWAYLEENSQLLDARGSSIYRNRPRFSVFGVGDYTFAPWKVAISGFYKRISFSVVGPVNGKPVVLDDASYFLGCQSQEEAELVVELLNSSIAHEFLMAFIFWDSKRPITVDLLRRLDLMKLACELGRADALQGFLNSKLALMNTSAGLL